MEAERLALLRRFATQVREAIEANPESIARFRPATFPVGACDGTCHLVAPFLKELGFAPLEIVIGRLKGDHGNHAWLDVEGTYVDLTADQYSNSPGKVVVESLDWFNQFDVIDRWSAEMPDLTCLPGLMEQVQNYRQTLRLYLT